MIVVLWGGFFFAFFRCGENSTKTVVVTSKLMNWRYNSCFSLGHILTEHFFACFCLQSKHHLVVMLSLSGLLESFVKTSKEGQWSDRREINRVHRHHGTYLVHLEGRDMGGWHNKKGRDASPQWLKHTEPIFRVPIRVSCLVDFLVLRLASGPRSVGSTNTRDGWSSPETDLTETRKSFCFCHLQLQLFDANKDGKLQLSEMAKWVC